MPCTQQLNPAPRRPRKLAFAAVVALLQACASVPPDTAALIEPDLPLVRLAEAGDGCRTNTAVRAGAPSIDPERVSLVNWNVQKGGGEGWNDQLGVLAEGADVVLLQEAPLVNDGWREADAADFHAFAPGFETRGTPTGVLTISGIAPLVQCNLRAREPWLRSPKATAVTEYALSGRDDTLLVVNIHAVNFTFGLGAFERQLEAAADVIARHDGPAIFAGDFNTWRRARRALVDTLVASHGMAPVNFPSDRRKRFLGQPLDHVYVRGMDVVSAASFETNTSDHNPMRVWLSAP